VVTVEQGGPNTVLFRYWAAGVSSGDEDTTQCVINGIDGSNATLVDFADTSGTYGISASEFSDPDWPADATGLPWSITSSFNPNAAAQSGLVITGPGIFYVISPSPTIANIFLSNATQTGTPDLSQIQVNGVPATSAVVTPGRVQVSNPAWSLHTGAVIQFTGPFLPGVIPSFWTVVHHT